MMDTDVTKEDKNNQDKNNQYKNNHKKYNGSNIGILSSHLFLLASLFNYYHNNIIECISIFILYITSIFYHNNGESNINYKIVDEYCCRIVIIICILLSLPKYNIYPTIATLFISIMYYNNLNYTNILHSILIHLPGSLGFFSIYYNYNFSNHNINSQIFMLWLSLILISLLYLIYYEFYLSYKINLLNINIKNLKIGSIN